MMTIALIGRRARLPFLWVTAGLVAAPLTGALLKGTLQQSENWPLWLAFTGSIIGAVGLLLPWELRLHRQPRLRELLMLAGAAMASSVLLLFDTPAYEPALFTAAVFLCTMVILFGHGVLGASIAAILLALRSVAAAVRVPDAPPTLFVDLYPIFIIALALTWLAYARHLARREAGFRANARTELRALQEQERLLADLRMRNSIVASGAHHVLERLVQTRTLTPELEREVRMAEAALRDHLRCPRLSEPGLTAEIRAARRRGVEVLLLGEGDTDRETIGRPLASALEQRLRTTDAGERVTIRLLPEHDDAEVSVVIDSAHEGASPSTAEPLRLDPHGRALTTPQG
ncbi:MAG: hypothetical protein P0Y48_13425 [Candidatus Microbacterium phytovorans]|uniref:Uncharacterized protein n=1 Tax=Candidatus Microbacterium phytovorans TaxID=3121374 RepID=A0AAJ5W2F1_9MICO|nr:hypothetical protein [Microbacterium sp.]WEK13441.1 MAG: hypothetical protein P0Y48_13425 [Microbacterium sp.]